MTRSDIRFKAMAVLRRGKSDLLCLNIREPSGEHIGYRIPGGHVEFGEKAADTLVREIQEEIGADLVNIRHIGLVENLYVWGGKPGHEVVMVYAADFVDEGFYARDVIDGIENGDPLTLQWVDINDPSVTLLPRGLKDIL